MRSYSYSQGTWQLITDPLATITAAPSDYDFTVALSSLGFGEFPTGSNFDCRAGSLKVYARNHRELSAQRKQKELTYDFLCILYFGGSYIRIWITDLHDILLFLEEVGAHTKADDKVGEFLEGDTLGEIMGYARLILSSLLEGDLEIIVKTPKPPPPPQRRVQ